MKSCWTLSTFVSFALSYLLDSDLFKNIFLKKYSTGTFVLYKNIKIFENAINDVENYKNYKFHFYVNFEKHVHIKNLKNKYVYKLKYKIVQLKIRRTI